MHRLDLDPQTAPLEQWIFPRRLAGASVVGIARVLNERRVPSPAAHDLVQNPHRMGTVWMLRTVAAILANPRYTGRQVWNRQRTDHHESVPGDKRSSLGITRDWGPRSDWIISARRTHPALVSDADFLAAQQVTAISTPADSRARRYQLTGLLICGLCGRRLEAHGVHGRPGYRCRHGHTTARRPGGRPRAIYWPEQRILTEMLYQLAVAGKLPPGARPPISSPTCEVVAPSSCARQVSSTSPNPATISIPPNGLTGLRQRSLRAGSPPSARYRNPHHIHPRKE